MGHLCIYLRQGDRVASPRGWRGRWFGKSLTRHIIEAARRDGILNATAHSAHYGFSGGDRIESEYTETTNLRLAVFVELVAERPRLEQFVSDHATLLAQRILLYKHVERWDLGSAGD